MKVLRHFLPLLILGLSLIPHCVTAEEAKQAPAAPQFDWDPIEINGKAYVTFEKLKLFYQADQLDYEDKDIHIGQRMWQARFRVASHVASINRVKFLLSEPILLKKDNKPCISQLDLQTLIDPVLRPNYIANAKRFKTVIIDAGHGGKDKGAAGLEAGETLKLALLLQKMLVDRGFKVVLTRDKDVTVPLTDRVKIANACDQAIMLSLHYNAGAQQAHGFETYVMSARVATVANPNNSASIALATAVHSRCLLQLNDIRSGHNFEIADRGIRRARFTLLQHCRHPAIYIEAGFLTNKTESEKIQSDAYRKNLASGITRGILIYQQSLRK